jgi:hypothetical protein
MAILNDQYELKGSFGNLTAYRMKGVDKVVVRTKGGASKQKIKSAPSMAKTRENFTEFSGCAKMSKEIREAIEPIKHLADYNFTPQLTSLAKKIQLQDSSNERGKRNIQLADFKYLLEGFQLNKRYSFDTVFRHAPKVSLNRLLPSATIQIPALIPGVNFHNFWPQPLYRIICSIGLVNNLQFNSLGYQFPPPLAKVYCTAIFSNWLSIKDQQPSEEISIQLPSTIALNEQQSLVVGMGIEMGNPINNQTVEHVKYAGAGKIIAVG